MYTTNGSNSPKTTPTGLSPVLGTRWVLTWKHLAMCLLFGLSFLYLSYRPLASWQFQPDVQQGRQILRQGVVVEADAAWLSQVACALVQQRGGPQYVANLLALSILAYLLILSRVLFLRTGRIAPTLTAVGIVLLIGCCVGAGTVPEVFGMVCLAVLLWLVARRRAAEPGASRHADAEGIGRWYLWPAIVVLFAAWANLHESVLFGIAVPACWLLGRVIATGWTARRIGAVLRDKQVHRLTLLSVLAAAAWLANPAGQIPAIFPAGVPGWLAVAAAMAIAPRLAELVAGVLPAGENDLQPNHGPIALSPRSFTITLACVLVAWCCFALSPTGNSILGGQRPNVEQPTN